MPSCKAALFDLDGTLIDSLYVWEKIDRDFLSKRGLTVPDHYAEALSAKGFRESAEYTIRLFHLPETPEELMAEWNRMALDEYSRRVPLKPHAKEYLSYLKGRDIKLAAATALPRALYEPVLKNNGVYAFFNAFASTDETGRGKDSPDVYLLAAEKLGAAPETCVVFEDVLAGVRAAGRAGMRTCGVFDRHSAGQKEQIKQIADTFIYDFSELMESGTERG